MKLTICTHALYNSDWKWGGQQICIHIWPQALEWLLLPMGGDKKHTVFFVGRCKICRPQAWHLHTSPSSCWCPDCKGGWGGPKGKAAKARLEGERNWQFPRWCEVDFSWTSSRKTKQQNMSGWVALLGWSNSFWVSLLGTQPPSKHFPPLCNW